MNCILTYPPFCVKCRQANFMSVNSANSVSSRRYQILLTDIRLEATQHVQIVCKMQMAILHFTLNTLCCLLLYRASVLKHIIIHFTRTDKCVAFWTQSNKFSHRHSIQFTFEESKCFTIRCIIMRMVERILAKVISISSIISHISICRLPVLHRLNYQYS